MKLKKLFLISCCAFLLAGCGTAEDTSSEVSSAPSSTSSEEQQQQPVANESVLTDAVLDKNVNVNEAYKNESIQYKATKMALPANATYTLLSNNLSYGVAIVENDENEVGLYSYLAGKLLISPRLENNNFHFYDDGQFGCHFMYRDVDFRYYLADGAGNVLYATDDADIYNYDGFELTYVPDYENEILYSRLTVQEAQTVNKYFKYSDKGVATEIDELPSEEDPNALKPGDAYLSQNNAVDLSGLGLNRFYIKISQYQYLVYDNTNKYVGTVNLPAGLGLFGQFYSYVIGTKIYYQQAFALPQDEAQYDTVYNGSKIAFETYCVDLATLETSKVKFAGLFQAVNTIYDENEAPKYASLQYYVVRPDKKIGETKTYVVDENLKLYDDITYQTHLRGTKLSNGNYYSNSKLFTKEGVLIADMSNLSNVNVNYAKELFFGYKNYTSLVIVNNEGKLLIPEDTYYYDSYNLIVNNIYRLRRLSDYEYVYYDLEAMEEIELDQTTEQIKYNCFIAKMTSTVSQTSGTIYSYSLRQIDKTENLVSLRSYNTQANYSYSPNNVVNGNFFGYQGRYIYFGYTNNESQYVTDYYLLTETAHTFNATAISSPAKLKRVYAQFNEWTTDNAVIYAWAWKNGGNGGAWYKWYGNNNDEFFGVGADCDRLCLVRFKAGTTEPSWDDMTAVWNQSEDLEIEDGKELRFEAFGENGEKDIFGWYTII